MDSAPNGTPQATSKKNNPGQLTQSAAPIAEMRLIGQRITPEQLERAKRAFVTRRMAIDTACFLARPAMAPRAGDILLARVTSLGQHSRLELATGRRSHMFVGDEIIVAYGERYATDQFHSKLPEDFSDCDLVAAGGIASQVIEKSAKIRNATCISPLGLLADAEGQPLNLAQAALPAIGADEPSANHPQIIAVVGSAMNAGKTTTAANIVHCLKRAGVNVAACKATGTGAGGDVWRLRDAGAEPVYDFTDAGYASTYNVPADDIQKILRTLVGNIAREGAEAIIVEVADGLFQRETQELLQSEYFHSLVDNIVFAAGDAISAAAGVQILDAWGFTPAAISGALTASPLAVAETESITGMPVLTNSHFTNDETILTTLIQSARSGTR
jgi:molybdopterin cofactor biosynthesis protein B